MAINAESIKAGYNRLTDRQKISVPLAVIAILGGLYFYFMYMPMQEEHASLEVKLVDIQKKLSQSKAVAADLPRFEAEAKVLNEKLAEALTKLPSSDEIPQLLKDMEMLGNDSGVEFNSVVLKGDAPRGFYAEVPVDLKLSGGYHSVALFIDKLSRLPRIINISSLSFSAPKTVDGQIVLSVSCLATTYKFLSN